MIQVSECCGNQYHAAPCRDCNRDPYSAECMDCATCLGDGTMRVCDACCEPCLTESRRSYNTRRFNEMVDEYGPPRVSQRHSGAYIDH